MARRSRRQKKQDQLMAESTAAQAESLQGLAGISETISGLLQGEVSSRQQIVAIQKTQNGLASNYVNNIKKALTEIKKMPSAFDSVSQAMVKTKKKEDTENKKTNDKQISAYERIKQAAIDAFNNNMVIRGLKGIENQTSKIGLSFKNIGKTALGLGKVAIAGIGGFFSFIFASLFKVNTRIDKVGEAFGFLAQGGRGTFFDNLSNAAIDVQRIGGGIADVVAVTQTLSGEFGIGLGEASKLAKETVEIAKGLGMSNENSAKLVGLLNRQFNLSKAQRENFVDITKNIAVQRGIAPNRVFDQLATASAKTLVSTGGSAKNLRNAAIAATDAGIELNSIAEGTDRLLDMQATFGDEVLVNTMLQQSGIDGINLSLARRLKAEGNLSGLLAEQQRIIQKVTKSQGFQNLNAAQQRILQEKLAQSIGLQLDQVVKLKNETSDLTDINMATADELRDMNLDNLTTQLTSIMGPFTEFKNLISAILADIGFDVFKELQPVIEKLLKDLKQYLDSEGPEKVANSIVSAARSLSNLIKEADKFFDRVSEKGIFGAMFGRSEADQMAEEARLQAQQERVNRQNERSVYNNPDVTTAGRTFQTTGKQVMMEHDLPAGVFAEAAAPNTPVVITSGGGDPEGIIRKSTVESMMAAGMGGKSDDIIAGLENVVEAISELNLETVISADQIRVIMAQGK